jgi:tetratricopeptide (TPR) repeat protein
VRLVCLCLLLVGTSLRASAAPAEVEQTDLAKRRYETGKWLYEHERYEEALVEFQAAKLASPRPELDYNIGLCLAAVGRPSEAADALRRYVASRPNDANADDARHQIVELDKKVVAAAITAPPPRRSRAPIALGLGVTGLVLLATSVGTGAVVLAHRDDVATYDRNRALAITTDVLWSVGGGLAISGLVVYLTDPARRSKRNERRPQLGTTFVAASSAP